MKHIFLFIALVGSVQLFGQSGLVSFISFDNNTVEEDSGNGQNGLFMNPSFDCGVKGQALVFDGVTDELLILGMGNTLSKNDFTISFYIKPEFTSFSQLVMSKRELCDNVNSFAYDYAPASRSLIQKFSENGSKNFDDTFSLDLNTCWYHIAFVRLNSVARIYVNGVELKSRDTNTRVDISNDAELIFGGSPCSSSPSKVRFKGLLDEVMIFNRALNIEEVNNLYLEPNRITTARDTLVFLGTSLDIKSNESCADAFFWSPSDGVSDVTSSTPTLTPTETTVYTMESDIDGCTALDSVRVKVIDPNDINCEEVFLPSAFTPNDDGRNDMYGLSNPFALEELISFEIFDRWGGRVFFTTDGMQKWDGYFKGQPMNPGVLLYRVHYRCNNEEKTQVGSVTLMR